MYLFRIQAFKKKKTIGKDKDDFQMIDVTYLTLHAENEKEALEKAKTMIVRPHYRVESMQEEHPKDDDLHADMQMTQLEMQKKMLDLFKKNT